MTRTIHISPYAIPGLRDAPESLPGRLPEIAVIIDMVAEIFGLSPEILMQKCRKREVVECRSMIMYLLKKKEGGFYTVTSIGEIFNKHHTTVIHDVRTFQNRLDTEPALFRKTREILYTLKTQANSKIETKEI